MNILKNRNAVSIQAIGYQDQLPGVEYEENRYVIREGDVAFNALTGEAAYLNEDDEAAEIRNWYMTPKGMDLAGLAHLTRQQAVRMNKPRSINGYVIFTTTGCNAGCWYCFQAGREAVPMSEQTALDVAKYIKANANPGRNIELRWFGGEPLMNRNVINLICQELKSAGRPYYSSMSSNGDLFPLVTDEELALWNLRQVQFTIDEPGEEYDKIKGLPEGAYERLKETIRRLENVRCTIRIHYDPEKGAEPCDRIIDDFKGFPNVTMYAAMLYDEPRKQEDYEALLRIEDHMIECGKMQPVLPDIKPGINCMADNRAMACITPTGDLTACEHYTAGQSYGTIYVKERDQALLDEWAAKTKDRDECMNCPLYPSCEMLCNCPAVGKCEEGYQYYRISAIRRALKRMG